MGNIQISNKQARALWLATNGLGTTPTGVLDVMAIIRALGFVQLDTTQVVSRAHHHILWSRNQNYREPMLDKLLAKDRAIFEHFTHDASVLPMEFIPMWRRQFRRRKELIDRSGWFKSMTDEAGRNDIKLRIEREGPLSTHAFDTKVKGTKQMWARPPHKLALDYMWYSGELATCHRVNFTKFYNLASNVFPPDLWAQDLDDAEQIDWLCRSALERIGFGTPKEIQKFWEAVDLKEVKDWLDANDDQLVKVEVESFDGSYVEAYALDNITKRLETLQAPTSRLRILNPFDPAIRDRIRLEKLFGFEYRVEMFVPAAKRKWGDYVFPILENDRFVGRIEVKADRNKNQLNILNIWTENGIKWTDARSKKISAELERLASFASVETIIWHCDRMPIIN